MVDKKSIKKKSVLQKQKQKQSVVVNINTHKPKAQPRPRKRKPIDSETLLEKQQKQLIYPSVIHTQPENIFDKVMSIQRQTQIDNALEQLTKTERNNLLEKAKKESPLDTQIKPKIVEISSRTLPSTISTPISVSGSFTNVPLTAPLAPATPATTTLLTPINTTQSPITTVPEPTPINTTVQRDITVLETPAVPESAIVAYVGNKTPSQNTAQQAAESRPYLTAVNIPSSYSSPFSGSGQKLDTTLTNLNKKYISRQMLAEITQKRIDDAQRQAEIDQLNEPNIGGIILSPPKIKLPSPESLQPKRKKQKEIANRLKEYSRDSLLQIAKDNGISQKKGENKQNLLERLYQLDPTKILWNNYEKLKRTPKNNLIK